MFKREVSFHWLIPGKDEREHGHFIWICAPEDRAAWHVRSDCSHPEVNGGCRYVNYWSLSVEIVNTQQADDPFSDWQVEQAAALVRYAWSKYPDLVDVVSHAKLDPQRRTDPGPLFPWERFRQMVLEQLA
jgi:N-acetylmuramoyl-L-alanine amidase